MVFSRRNAIDLNNEKIKKMSTSFVHKKYAAADCIRECEPSSMDHLEHASLHIIWFDVTLVEASDLSYILCTCHSMCVVTIWINDYDAGTYLDAKLIYTTDQRLCICIIHLLLSNAAGMCIQNIQNRYIIWHTACGQPSNKNSVCACRQCSRVTIDLIPYGIR